MRLRDVITWREGIAFLFAAGALLDQESGIFGALAVGIILMVGIRRIEEAIRRQSPQEAWWVTVLVTAVLLVVAGVVGQARH